jgi:hypothetical protein
MPEYLSPGVYVEEVDRGPKPIEGVGTAMPVFIGFTEKAERLRRVGDEFVKEDVLNKPVLVTNWTQYMETFGGFLEGAYMPLSVYGYFQNGGSRAYVLSVKTIPRATVSLLNNAGKAGLLVQAKQAGFGGKRLRVKIDAAAAPAAPAKKEEGAAAPAEPAGTGFTVTVEQQSANGSWATKEVIKDVNLAELDADGGKKVAVAYPRNKGSEFVDLVIPEGSTKLADLMPKTQEQALNIDMKLLSAPKPTDFQGNAVERTGLDGLEAIDDITMVAVPDLMSTAPGEALDKTMVKAVQTAMIAHCEKMGDRVAVLDCPPDMLPTEVNEWRMDTTGFDSSYAAMYYPWIEVSDPATNKPALIPPSGFVAGVWSRNDNTRGVHKAPANEVVRGATGLAYNVTSGEQAILNPNGVNCIRAFPGMGIRVWGARTLSSNPAWRYISIRRLFNYIEKSIERGTQWVVFEPNEPRLWGQVRRDVGAFLTMVWRDGALFGSSPTDAFYVKCDSETNPPESRDMGRLIIEIGVAPVKPAEFVIFRISQWSPELG